MVKKLLVLLSVLLSACSASPTPPLSEQITLKPTIAPTNLPSPISTEAPVILPQPTTDPNSFRDDFTGSLDPQWSWIREDPKNWSLTTIPGSLQINVAGGYVVANTNSNLLLRPAPSGNFQIETQISFNPGDNYQFAGLIIYESAADFIQAGRAYCRSYECVGEGLYMNYYKKGVVVKPDFGQTYKDAKPILLRLSRRVDTYTFEASADGKVWFVVGSHISDIKPLKIGLVTGQRVKGSNLPAVFDYFEVRSLP
jgi:beta-xylosidase